MKKVERILRSSLCALALLFSSSGLYAMTWVGTSTPDVTDTNLTLNGSGPITLQGTDPCNATSINALTTNVEVTIENGNALITGNAVGPTILRLNAAAGQTINFNLTGLYSLEFQGSSDVPLSPLLILQEGIGNVTFTIRGGISLTFTNNPGVNGPVLFYQILQTAGVPSLSFLRSPSTPEQALQVFITIGAGSLLSYASTDGLNNMSQGSMTFDPTNSGNGRMVLQINDTGAFTMAVHQAVFDDDSGDICSVNRNIPAGGTATTTIINSNPAGSDAGLMINNYNATYAEYLIDPYGDLNAASDATNYSGSFDGLRYGMVAGSNHTLVIGDNAFLDYVGLANNSCPTPGSLPGIVNPDQPATCPCGPGVNQFLKARNYSALTIDGWYNPSANASQINLGTQSGIYFRSGVDSAGNVNNNFLSDPFTINSTLQTPGAGEYVFDVEAPVFINGQNVNTNETLNSRLEILSLEVIPHSGPLFPVEGNPMLTDFLGRTFNTDETGFYQYNSAAWLINDQMNLINTALAHTDVNHIIVENNDVLSQPTYVGGEKWSLSALRGTSYPNNYCISTSCLPVSRPAINFYDSLLQVQSSMGVTGVDLWVPTYIGGDFTPLNNFSAFTFYSNGYLVDNGTGRSMILGTLIGSQACDGCTIISDDAHLNIIQNQDVTSEGPEPQPYQELVLLASQNNDAINNQIVEPITGQTSIESIYLGHNSNISIGFDGAPQFPTRTIQLLLIAGDFFHIGTRGGALGIPSTSDVTGQGGIFVDTDGILAIEDGYIASLDVMVTLSQQGDNPLEWGMVFLPPSQVFFSDRVGIANWQQNLNINQVIVPTGQYFSDYTLNWLTLTKSPAFFPYLISSVNVCSCPPFTAANMTEIPTIQGQVDQLQITASRIGDPAHILISGGWVRELLFISECLPAEAPTAVVVLNDNGRLGLNNAHRNPDSLLTQTVLGANGINIVADGNGRIDLNDDVIINNICAFIQGPDWVAGNVLRIHSDDAYTLYVTQDGVLDFSSFTTGTVRFDGNIKVVFEPGATLVLGTTGANALIQFGDQAVFEVSTSYELQGILQALDNAAGTIDNTVNPLVSAAYTGANNQYSPLTGYGTGVQNTDPFRVRMLGSGTLSFEDNSVANIRTNAVLGIETTYQVNDDGLVCANNVLNYVTIQLLDAAQFNIGKGNTTLGGAFQVGDTQSFAGNTINFTLTINGADAQFNVGSGGFFGLGAGVARPSQGAGDPQTNVLADALFSVGTVTLNLLGGELSVNRIFNSDDPNSHSMVIGALNSFNVNYVIEDDIAQLNAADYLTSGGGNLFLLNAGSANAGNSGVMRLINRFDDNVINAPYGTTTVPLTRLFAGILASTELTLLISSMGDTPQEAFLLLKTGDSTNASGPSYGLADTAPLNPERFRQERTFGLAGYVDRGRIGRNSFQDVIDAEGGTAGERRSRVYDLGAGFVQIDTSQPAPGPVLSIGQILSE